MNPNKQKGTGWETACVKTIQLLTGFFAFRKTLAGKDDKGDIAIQQRPYIVIEAKNAKKYNFAGWVEEAEKEAENSGVPIGVVWAHRDRKSNPADGYVVMTGKTFCRVLELLPNKIQ